MDSGIRFRHLPGAEVRALLTRHSEQDLKLFRESWGELPVDGYLPDGADYRRRRYGCFRGVDRMVEQSDATFYQTTEVNALNGGVDRSFPPLQPEFTRPDSVLRTLVGRLAHLLPGPFDRERGAVGVHQVRVTATRGEHGLPTPEGVHEDGHHCVAQVFMGRHGVVGGVAHLRPGAPAAAQHLFDRALRSDRHR